MRKLHEWAFLFIYEILRANQETKVCVNSQARGLVESLRLAQFATLDLLRRAQGHALVLSDGGRYHVLRRYQA